MKKLLPILIFSLITTFGFCQSESFMILKDKFRGEENVVSFGASGFVAKTILWAAGEREYKDVFQDIRHVRFIVIPKKAFREKKVSVEGFKKVAAQTDHFQEVMTIKDGSDDVSLLVQEDPKQRENVYLLLVDDHSELVAVEMTGYLNPSSLRKSFENSYGHNFKGVRVSYNYNYNWQHNYWRSNYNWRHNYNWNRNYRYRWHNLRQL